MVYKIKYKVNLDFFKKWTPKMAWVLGFIFADGNLDFNKKSRSLRISSIDLDVLEKINKAMDSNYPVRKVKNDRGFGKKGSFIYLLRISRKEIYEDLLKIGVKEKKTLRLELPIIPKKYFNHFVRGYFDGDGNVMKQKTKGYVRVENGYKMKKKAVDFYVYPKCRFYSGCVDFLKQLKEKLIEFGFNSWIGKCPTESVLVVGSTKIFSWLYKNNQGYCMDRKYNALKNFGC